MRKSLPIACLALAACQAASGTVSSAPSAAAAAGPDGHSFARPDLVRVVHLDLELGLDFRLAMAAGSCTLHLERRDPAAPLVLDTDRLHIGSVEDPDDGTPLPFTLGARDPILGQPLVVELPPETRRVRVHYATLPDGAEAMQWLRPAQTQGGQHPFLFTQGQAILTRTWIPLQDSPGVRVTWNATIRAPAGLRPLMSAQQSGQDAAGAWTFAMPLPVPPYLIALACGDLARHELSPRCAVWAEPAVLPEAAAELADMERMLAACEELFGPYRWGRYDVLILPPSFPFGGMENPCLTFATPTILAGDKSLVALIAHELAHSWSGNLVTNATWRDFWLNEGFTVYLEQRIMEHVYGRERAAMEIALGMRELAAELRRLPAREQVLHIELQGRNPDDGMTAVPYEKGAAFLRRLEQLCGRPRLDAFLRRWFDVHAFQSVTTTQFEAFLHDALLADDPALLAAVDLDEWLRAPGLPAAAPVPDAAAFQRVDAVREAVVQGRTAAPLSVAAGWSTQEWLRFLDGLPADAELLARIDAAQQLTMRRNAEVLTAWLALAIAADYAPAQPRLEQFLLAVGRRKFLQPLYAALLERPGGRDRALSIYERARPRYHAVAVRTLDELLGWPPR